MKIYSFAHLYPWPLLCYERSSFLNHTSNHVAVIQACKKQNKPKKQLYLRHWIKSNAFRNQYKGSPYPSDYCDCIIEYWSTDLKLSFSDTAIAARLTWPLSDISEVRGRTARSVYNLYWSSNLQELSKRDSTEPLKKGLAYGPHTGPQPDNPSCCSVKPSTSWVWLEEISKGLRGTHGQRIASGRIFWLTDQENPKKLNLHPLTYIFIITLLVLTSEMLVSRQH